MRPDSASPDVCYQPRRPVRYETLPLRGLAARVAHWGDSAADPVLLLHGFLDCCTTFQFLVDELPDDLNFVALDWRGFGESAQSGAPYWFPDYLADLDALLEVLAPEWPLRLLGHSMGGNIASLYAGIRPQRVRAVVSLEGFGLPPTRAEQAPARYGRWLDELRAPLERSHYESIEQFTQLLQRRNARLSAARARFIAQAWTRPVAAGGVQLCADPWHRLINPQLYRREEAEACWQAYDGPVQMVVADKSEHLRHHGDNIGRAAFDTVFRKLELATVKGAGHMMHHEDPAQVARVVLPFLQRHAAAMPGLP